MSKKIYCGIGQIPKGARLGSMKECADRNQIRYYGIKKIDPKLVEAIQKSKEPSDRDQIFKDITKYKGKIKRIKDKIAGTKDKTVKNKLQKELEKIVEDTNKLIKQFNEIEKRRQKRFNNFDQTEFEDRINYGGFGSSNRSRSLNRSRGSDKRRSSNRSRSLNRSRSYAFDGYGS